MHKDFIPEIAKWFDFHKEKWDYLRVVLKEDNLKGCEDLVRDIDLLDYDNSNFWNKKFSDHTITKIKIRTKKGTAIIWLVSYKEIPQPLFFFERYLEHEAKLTKSWGRIDFYWALDRLIEIWYISRKWEWTLLDYIDKIWGKRKITRFDWRIDYFSNDENKKIMLPKDVTKLRSNSKVKYDTEWDRVTWWKLWDRKSKRYVIRAYDKLLDTRVKGKFLLYLDYFKFKNVYRLEFEFLNHFCKDYTFDRREELRDHICAFLNYDKSIWPIFESRNNTDINEVKDRFKYADSTKWYMRWCIEAGMNIFWLLDEVFCSMGKDRGDIMDMFKDYLDRTYNFESYSENKKIIDLMKEVSLVFK